MSTLQPAWWHMFGHLATFWWQHGWGVCHPSFCRDFVPLYSGTIFRPQHGWGSVILLSVSLSLCDYITKMHLSAVLLAQLCRAALQLNITSLSLSFILDTAAEKSDLVLIWPYYICMRDRHKIQRLEDLLSINPFATGNSTLMRERLFDTDTYITTLVLPKTR